MAKIKMKHSITAADTFADFLTGKKTAGVGGKPLVTYAQHFSAISKRLSPASLLTGRDRQYFLTSQRKCTIVNMVKAAALFAPKKSKKTQTGETEW